MRKRPGALVLVALALAGGCTRPSDEALADCSNAIKRTVAGGEQKLRPGEVAACRAAEALGSARSGYALGMDALAREQFGKAREHFQLAAMRGSGEADYVLGMMAYEEDPARASRHLERAARQPSVITRASIAHLSKLSARQGDTVGALAWAYVLEAAGWTTKEAIAQREADCSPGQRGEAKDRAIAWLKEAGYAERGFPRL